MLLASLLVSSPIRSDSVLTLRIPKGMTPTLNQNDFFFFCFLTLDPKFQEILIDNMDSCHSLSEAILWWSASCYGKCFLSICLAFVSSNVNACLESLNDDFDVFVIENKYLIQAGNRKKHSATLAEGVPSFNISRNIFAIMHKRDELTET